MSTEYDAEKDCLDSYYAAIAEIRRSVKDGERKRPATGYFAETQLRDACAPRESALCEAERRR